MFVPDVERAMPESALQQQQKASPRWHVLRKTNRKAQKTLGSIMKSLLLSPNRSSKPSHNLLNVKVEVPTITQSPQRQLPTATLESSVKLLSSPNVDDNRKGLHLLLTLTKVNKIVSSPRTNISQRIVMGGSDRTANRVRNLLLSFLCNDVDIHAMPTAMPFDDDDDDDSIMSALSDAFCGLVDVSTWEDDHDFDDDDDDENPSGSHWGSLHCSALRVVVNCLEHVSSSHSTFGKSSKITIDYSSTFWTAVVQTLSMNLESANNLDVCGFSLRCLRLLVSLDSPVILPMMKYTMLPYIMNLKECRSTQNYKMIKDEATELLTYLV
jgi:hypothetical protein